MKSGEYRGIEIGETRGRNAFSRRSSTLLIAAVALISSAATTVVSLDVMHWRGSAPLARAVLEEQARNARQRIEAIVVVQRDALTSIESLRLAAESHDASAEHARNALHAINEASR